jgi:uncharacterized protein YggE/plastocyanin
VRKIILVIPAIALLLVILALGPDSFSATHGQQADSILSASSGVVIKTTGDASQTVEPDQISLILNVQTEPVTLDEVPSKFQNIINSLTNSIESSLGQGNYKILVAPTNLNPFYFGGGVPSNTKFTTYSSINIKTDIDHYYSLSSKLSEAGFRVDGISIREIPVTKGETPTKTIVIPTGSSTPTNSPFFVPENAAIREGTTVVWTNNDEAAHTVTSGSPEKGPDGIFDSGLFMAGRTYEYTFYEEGEFPYYCLVHPWQSGKIVVVRGEMARPAPTETRREVSLNVVVETVPDTIQNAIDSFQKRIDTLKQIMEESGVSSESIKSNQINFNQVYYGNPQYSLYNTYTRVIVSADIDDFEILSKAIDVPGVSIETMSFTVSDKTLDKTRKDLVQQALENAIMRANDVAEAAGLKVKSIKSIEVSTPSSQGGYNTIVYRGVSISPAYDNSIYNLGQLAVTVHAEFEMSK